MTLGLNSNRLISILIALLGTLSFLGYQSNERRLAILEQWRIDHDVFVLQQVTQITRQLATVESEVKWIRKEMENSKRRK
jgi:hypothetical protein